MTLEDLVVELLAQKSDALILEARRTQRSFKSPWKTRAELREEQSTKEDKEKSK